MNLIEQLGGYEKAKSIIDHAPKYAKGWFGGIYYKQGEWCWWWSEYLKKWLQDEKHIGHITRYTQSFKLCDVKKALLEYRRQNNIFEVGDSFVFNGGDNPEIMKVQHVWDDAVWGGYCGEIPKNTDIRHATDDEIQAGRRL